MSIGSGYPTLKLARAREHLEALREGISAYRDGDAFCAEERFDSSDGWIYLILRVAVAPPLERWSLIFGDCIHNVRAALDQLAWQLDSSPDKSTRFPIMVTKPQQWPPAAVARMDPRAQTIIQQLQPYRVTPGQGQGTPETHPLATLHRLDIADKHKVLTVTTGGVGGDSISGLPFESSVESAGWQVWGNGAELGRIRLPGSATQLGAIGYRPYFNAVLAEPPLESADVMWVAEALLIDWVSEYAISLPFART